MSLESVLNNETAAKEQWRSLLELATCEVFDIMLGSRLEPCRDAETEIASDFTAMVGLAGTLCGVLSIRCTALAANLMASRMLGVDPGEAEQQSWDAIGEVCNMVAGNFKAKLAALGSQCMLSVPTIITGADYQLHSLADGGTVETALKFEDMIVWVTLEVHS